MELKGKVFYSEIQISWLVIALCLGVIFFIAAVMLSVPFNPIAFSIMVFVVLIFTGCLFVFSIMKTTVENKKLILRIGLIKRTFSLEPVVSCRVTEVPWYYGLGIRLIPLGLLCRIRGSKVVEIKTSDQRAYLIGSKNPEELAACIKKVVGSG